MSKKTIYRNIVHFYFSLLPCHSAFLKHKIKVKQSQYRPGHVRRASGGWGSDISIQSAHEGVNVIRPIYQPPLPL